MPDRFDEMTKLLAGTLPRREALKRLGGLFAGALLGLFGLGKRAHGDQIARPTTGQCQASCASCANTPLIYRACVNYCLQGRAICPGCTVCPANEICFSGVCCLAIDNPCDPDNSKCCPGLTCSGGGAYGGSTCQIPCID